MKKSDLATKTIDHGGPEASCNDPGVPALVCAFPAPCAVPVAALNGILGRKTLREAGVLDGEVSTEHARLVREGRTFRLTDLGSRNGTFVDGRRVLAGEPVSLVDGALLRVGRTVFVFRENLAGGVLPAAALGDLVAPFGVRALAQQLTALARRPNPFVLIEGATGTGKELLAKYVATILGRTNPYAAVNIAGIADGVFESQLFGHVAGAFSDARVASPGILAAHEHGAVFLDEIGSLALPLQSKLLRLLDQREILPVGASQPRTVDVLVIAATNGGLDQAVAEGRFRADLLARLAIARLELPPLRSRPEDLFTVAQKLASRHQIELDPANTEVEAIERMLAHDWPRNVRELEATLRQAATLDPRPGLRLWCVNRILGKPESTPTIALTEAAIEEALALEGGNETAAARRLGVTRGKLRRHLARKEPS